MDIPSVIVGDVCLCFFWNLCSIVIESERLLPFGEEINGSKGVGGCVNFPDGCEFHKLCLGCSTCVYVGCKLHG